MLWGAAWTRRSADDTPGFDRLLAEFPALARHLADAPVVSRDRGMGPFHQRVRGVHRGPVALLGDAAGYLDAITGEGLSLAVHQAFALAEVLAAARERPPAADPARILRPYARTVRRLRRLPDLLTRLLLLVEPRPTLRRRMLRTFAEDPELFSRLLGIHARQQPPASLGVRGALRLGRGLVRT
jgi:flavin-dependent dehydrogenase